MRRFVLLIVVTVMLAVSAAGQPVAAKAAPRRGAPPPPSARPSITDPAFTPRAHQPPALGGALPDVVRENQLDLTEHSSVYSILVGGTAHPINNFLRIENTGSTLVVRPRVALSGGPDWTSTDAILQTATAGAVTDREKAAMLWEFARKNRYHWQPATNQTREVCDPVALFSGYGYGFCSNVAASLSALWNRAGMPSRFWTLGPLAEHEVSEVWYDGAWHLLDADRDGLYIDRVTGSVLGVEDLIANPSTVMRAGPDHYDLVVTYGGTALDEWIPGDRNVFSDTKEIAINLRPEESIELRWTNVGQYHNDTDLDNTEPPFYGNGTIVSRLDPSTVAYRNWIKSESAVRSTADDGLSPKLSPAQAGQPGEVVFQVDSPYPIAAAQLSLDLYRASNADAIEVYAGGWSDGIELFGEEFSSVEGYQAPGVFVAEHNITSTSIDEQWPSLHSTNGTQPSWVVYRAKPRAGATQVLAGGVFYRFADTDATSLSFSNDGTSWTQVWSASPGQDGYFRSLVDVTSRLNGTEPFYLRYEFTAQSEGSLQSNWTAGVSSIEITGVEPLADSLVWSAGAFSPTGEFTETIDLTAAVAPNTRAAAYHYTIRVVMTSETDARAAGINGLTATTTVQVAPLSLPSLSLGSNDVCYTDASTEPTQVRVTQGWGERDGPRPPLPPSSPVTPVDGGTQEGGAPMQFRWSPSVDPDDGGISTYHVQICDDPQCRWPLTSTFDIDIENNDPLTPGWLVDYYDWFRSGQTYYWRVRARSATTGDWSDYGEIWSFVLQCTPPSAFAPQSVSATGEVLFVRWTPSSGANTYAVRLSTTNPPPPESEVITSESEYTNPALTPGAQYFWTVDAISSCDPTVRTAMTGGVQSVTMSCPAPGPFSAVAPAPSDVVSPTVTLSWAAAANATSYLVRVGTMNPPSGVTPVVTTATTLSLSGLESGTTYYWYVEASRDCASPTATVTDVRAFLVCDVGTPTALSPADNATTATSDVVFSWTPPAHATSYVLHLGRSNPPSELSVTVDASATTTLSLDPGTTWYWSVEARTDCSPAAVQSSPVQSFATPSQPTGLVAHWPLDGTGEDGSIQDNDATLTGTTEAADRFSRAGRAILLDATASGGSGAIVPDGPATDLSRAFTWAGWIRPARLGAASDTFVHKSSADGQRLMMAGETIVLAGPPAETRLKFQVSAGEGTTSIDAAGPSLEANRWYHVTLTYDGATRRMVMYVDGTLVAERNAAEGVPALLNNVGGPLVFGGAAGSTRTMSGVIDDVVWMGRAMDAAEVLALYQTTELGAPQSTVATWSAGKLNVSWLPVAGASSYRVSVNGAVLSESAATSVQFDAPVGARAFIVKVEALSTDGLRSSWGQPDVATATTFSDDPVLAGETPVRAVHVAELQAAIGDLQLVAGTPPATPFDAVAAGSPVLWQTFNDARDAIDAVRAAAGAVPVVWNAAGPGGSVITASFINQLRNALK